MKQQNLMKSFFLNKLALDLQSKFGTEQPVSSFTRLDWTGSLHKNNNICSFVVISCLVELETNCTVILSPTVSVLWPKLDHRIGILLHLFSYSKQRQTPTQNFEQYFDHRWWTACAGDQQVAGPLGEISSGELARRRPLTPTKCFSARTRFFSVYISLVGSI